MAERQQAALDRQQLLIQITELVNAQAVAQETRLASHAGAIRESIVQSTKALEENVAVYSNGMDEWNEKEDQLVGNVRESRDTIKTKLTADWNVSTCHAI